MMRYPTLLTAVVLVSSACAPAAAQQAEARQLRQTVERLQQQVATQGERIESLSHQLVILSDQMESARAPRTPAHRDGPPELQVVKLAPAPPPEDTSPPVVLTLADVEPAPAPKVAVATEDPEALFGRGLSAFQAGQATAAERHSQRFVDQHPAHAHAPRARYWLGEIHFEARRFDAALSSFETLLSEHPRSDKAADALLKTGLAHERLNQRKAARQAFEGVIEKFPQSALAELARARLAAHKNRRRR